MDDFERELEEIFNSEQFQYEINKNKNLIFYGTPTPLSLSPPPIEENLLKRVREEEEEEKENITPPNKRKRRVRHITNANDLSFKKYNYRDHDIVDLKSFGFFFYLTMNRTLTRFGPFDTIEICEKEHDKLAYRCGFGPEDYLSNADPREWEYNKRFKFEHEFNVYERNGVVNPLEDAPRPWREDTTSKYYHVYYNKGKDKWVTGFHRKNTGRYYGGYEYEEQAAQGLNDTIIEICLKQKKILYDDLAVNIGRNMTRRPKDVVV